MNTANLKQVRATDRQSLTDFAMQVYGCKDGVWLLLEDNPDRLTGISDVLTPGMVLNVRTPCPKITSNNQSIAAYYAAHQITVTSDPVDVSGGPTPSPIVQPYVKPGYIAGTTPVLPFGHIVPPHRIIVKIINANILPISLLTLHN